MEWYLAKKVGTVLGHEPVGVAVQVGRNVRHVREGELVFAHHHAPCMQCRYCAAGDHVHCPTWRRTKLDPGGMAEFIRVPKENALHDSFAIDDLDPERGIFVEPLGCSLRAFRHLRPERMSLGAIIGCGPMGLLNLLAARALGAQELWAIEPDEDRRAMALALGAQRALTPDQMRALCDQPGFERVDYAIVGPGRPDVILEATRCVRSGGVVVLFAPTPTGERTPLDLGDLYFREVTLTPAYSCGPLETRRAYELLRSGAVQPEQLISHRFPLEEVQCAYDVAKQGRKTIKVVVRFDQEKAP
jgi:L-iditol 2-dehydrogenase